MTLNDLGCIDYFFFYYNGRPAAVTIHKDGGGGGGGGHIARLGLGLVLALVKVTCR